MARGRLVVTAVALVGVAVALVVAAPLAPAPGWPPSSWEPWLAANGVARAVAGLLRIVCLVFTAWTLGGLVAGAAARAAGWAAAARATDALVLPGQRRLLDAAFGVAAVVAAATASGLHAGPVATGAATAAPAEPAEPPVLVRLPDDPPVLTRLPEAPAEPPAPPPRAAATMVAEEHDAGTEHVVVAGDHLWGLAERRLASGWGRAPSDAEIDPYWRTVVAANLDRLADPGNPDLLLPGQQVLLPPPPGAPDHAGSG